MLPKTLLAASVAVTTIPQIIPVLMTLTRVTFYASCPMLFHLVRLQSREIAIVLTLLELTRVNVRQVVILLHRVLGLQRADCH